MRSPAAMRWTFMYMYVYSARPLDGRLQITSLTQRRRTHLFMHRRSQGGALHWVHVHHPKAKKMGVIYRGTL